MRFRSHLKIVQVTNNMKKEYIKTIYKLWALIYDSALDKLFNFDRRKAVALLQLKSGEKVLEFGVGTGLNLRYYPHYVKVYGVDISKEMLAKAFAKKEKLQNKNIHLSLIDSEQLNFTDNFFDAAIATYVLRVAVSPKKCIQEIERVTKPNARIVFVDTFKGRFSFLLNPFTKILGFGRDLDLNWLLKDTKIKIVKSIRIKRATNTRVVVCRNLKN